MAAFLARRLVGLLTVLAAMSLILFLLQQVVPADPARAVVGPNAPQSAVEEKRREMGLDLPLPVRYWRYVVGLAAGDLGQSVHTHNPVKTDLARFLPASLELVLSALLLGMLIGAILAVTQSLSGWGRPLRFVLIAASSAPIFLTGLLLSLAFWYHLGWLPGGGRIDPDQFVSGPTGFLVLDGILTLQPGLVLSALAHLMLPAITLALPIAVSVGRTLAASLLGVYRQNYIRTARAKGLGERAVLFRHALRNAAAPALSMIGLQVALVLNNLLIVERLFAWPGLGLYTVQSLATADLPAVLGVAMVFATIYLVVAAAIDVVQALIDPRIGTG